MKSLPKRMIAMEFDGAGHPLRQAHRAVKAPSGGNILIEVAACGVCRTDLHVVDGDLQHAKRHVIPGHEVVGRVIAVGPSARHHRVGDRV
ncbi:MAG TPA: alcohol dehydrogenase catalytic domain-containing protein, partial [Hyphomicrobium sp.]|nr:alcohol dehydrogenase catalytic domain-containing protein [Hyphomicrobium sp.]